MTPALEVVEPGLLLTIQDTGRPGRAAEGITRGGAADTWSLAVANVLVGNPPDAAALEATLVGPTLRALRPVTVGLAGTMTGRVADTGATVAAGSSVSLAAGQTLVLSEAEGGARGYVAVPGGIDVPVILGSRSTAVGAGFGGHEGRPLRSGDVVAALDPAHGHPAARWSADVAPAPVTPDAPLRLLPGPRATDAALAAISAAAWTVTPTSDRVGLRLDGPPVPLAARGEVASHGVVAGSLQVPPDGHPIVLLPDHQPTGGYPVVGVVITADLPRLGQVAPGQLLAFALTTPEQARDALASLDTAFEGATQTCGRRRAGTPSGTRQVGEGTAKDG